jgi:RNA polymerase sigma-70 factor (ECF subfamily)
MEAFDILAAQYRDMVLVYLRTLVKDVHLAEDLTQETFLAAQKGLPEFREGASFGAWLRGIARNKALESRRAAARHRLIADSRVVEGMEQVYRLLDAPRSEAELWDDRLGLLRSCIGRLRGRMKDAVVEVYQRGSSLQDAAARLNISFDALAQRLHRVRALLYECMALGLRKEGAS